MAEKTEITVADKVIDLMGNHFFNPAIMARHLVTNQGSYIQGKVMDLAVEIIQHTAIQFDNAWEEGTTSEALFMAQRLSDYLTYFDSQDDEEYPWLEL